MTIHYSRGSLAYTWTTNSTCDAIVRSLPRLQVLGLVSRSVVARVCFYSAYVPQVFRFSVSSRYRTFSAYPWYTSVRTILDDPAYSDWFIKFKPVGPWYSPKCDTNSGKCSDYFHMQEQTPGYPSGDGTCAAPACDCGKSPCGFYLWNVSARTMISTRNAS